MNQPAKQVSEPTKKDLMLLNQKKITGLLEQMKGEIARCLPKHLTPERMARIALTELRKTPKLLECDPLSFIAAIMQASQLGLEPGVLGSCYLVPFKNNKTGKMECNFIPGYRGLLDLARRSGDIISISAEPVFQNDQFDFEKGLEPKLFHKPSLNEPGKFIAVYAVAHLKGGGYQFIVMSKKAIDEVKAKSKSQGGAWATDYEAMAQKTAIRRLFKWLPCSIEMQQAAQLDENAEIDNQNIKETVSDDLGIDFTTYDNESGEIFETELKQDSISQADKLAASMK
ncbi:DNA recombination protein RecT [Candidatus Nitrosocosmicus sp.]|nr:DNA recombination protein RecT [Candidatus Nitrosocosmicus sp.]